MAPDRLPQVGSAPVYSTDRAQTQASNTPQASNLSSDTLSVSAVSRINWTYTIPSHGDSRDLCYCSDNMNIHILSDKGCNSFIKWCSKFFGKESFSTKSWLLHWKLLLHYQEIQMFRKVSLAEGSKCLSDNRGATLKVCHLWLVGPDLSHVSLSSCWAQRVEFTPGLSMLNSKKKRFILMSAPIMWYFLLLSVF